MGVRTADEGRVQRPWQYDIGAELRTAFEKSIILEPWQSGANSELAHGKLRAIERSRSGKRPQGCQRFPKTNLDFVSNLR